MLPLDFGGQCAGQNGDDGHDESGKQTGGRDKVKLEIGKGEGVVQKQHADKCSGNAVYVSACGQRDQKYRKCKQRRVMLRNLKMLLQQQA